MTTPSSLQSRKSSDIPIRPWNFRAILAWMLRGMLFGALLGFVACVASAILSLIIKPFDDAVRLIQTNLVHDYPLGIMLLSSLLGILFGIAGLHVYALYCLPKTQALTKYLRVMLMGVWLGLSGFPLALMPGFAASIVLINEIFSQYGPSPPPPVDWIAQLPKMIWSCYIIGFGVAIVVAIISMTIASVIHAPPRWGRNFWAMRDAPYLLFGLTVGGVLVLLLFPNPNENRMLFDEILGFLTVIVAALVTAAVAGRLTEWHLCH